VLQPCPVPQPAEQARTGCDLRVYAELGLVNLHRITGTIWLLEPLEAEPELVHFGSKMSSLEHCLDLCFTELSLPRKPYNACNEDGKLACSRFLKPPSKHRGTEQFGSQLLPGQPELNWQQLRFGR
jgi:hypothetical protein